MMAGDSTRRGGVSLPRVRLRPVILLAVALLLAGCGNAPEPEVLGVGPTAGLLPVALAVTPQPLPAALLRTPEPTPVPEPVAVPTAATAERLEAGNPRGDATVPAAGRPVDTSRPDRVVGDGTAASCTSAAVVSAVAAGGVIAFSCGPGPVTIRMERTALVENRSARVVLDGGGLVTLSGGAVFFVSNDRSGELRVDGSTALRRNTSGGFETAWRPGIFVLDRTT